MTGDKPEHQRRSRYSRQMLFDGIGDAGQERISKSRVVVVGCGGLGTFQASLFARAGVGTLRIIDRDFVEESNLQRQILFDEQDAVGVMPKAIAAETKLRAVNSIIRIESFAEDVNSVTADRLLGGFDVIMDATDNFDTRYLLNDYAVKMKVPWIYGACVGSYGMTFPILPDDSGCLRCVFEQAPPAGATPTCETAGVIGPIVGVIACLQVAEALKLLSGRKDAVHRKITIVDLWANQSESVDLPSKIAECPCCGRHEFVYLDGSQGAGATVLCGRNSVQVRRPDLTRVDLDELAERLKSVCEVEKNRFLIRASVEGYQLAVFPDGRAIVSGTNDAAVAKTLYARYIGS